MNQRNEEVEQKLNAMKEKYQRRPVVLTAVSPGKGEMMDAVVVQVEQSVGWVCLCVWTMTFDLDYL